VPSAVQYTLHANFSSSSKQENKSWLMTPVHTGACITRHLSLQAIEVENIKQFHNSEIDTGLFRPHDTHSCFLIAVHALEGYGFVQLGMLLALPCSKDE
jgi:hypothetical protein